MSVTYDYRIVRCISRDFQTLIWALKTYLGLYTEYEMLIISFSSMINISYSVYRPGMFSEPKLASESLGLYTGQYGICQH